MFADGASEWIEYLHLHMIMHSLFNKVNNIIAILSNSQNLI